MARRQGWLTLTWITLCLFLPLSVQALPRVQVLGSAAGESAELAGLLQKGLRDEVEVVSGEALLANVDLLVAGSEEIFRRLPEKHPSTLVLAPGPSALELQKQDSAVYWSPSLAAQLALVRYLLPATNRVGMLSSSADDLSWLRVFRQYAAEQSIEIRIVAADVPHLARQVSELAGSTDVLLAQPDVSLYNRDTIRLVLLSAYRQNRVLIGPSPAFVRAGALATLYAPTEAIAEAVMQRVHFWMRNGKLPPPSRLKNFSVSLNPQVARAMGLNVPAVNELERMLRFEELPTWP